MRKIFCKFSAQKLIFSLGKTVKVGYKKAYVLLLLSNAIISHLFLPAAIIRYDSPNERTKYWRTKTHKICRKKDFKVLAQSLKSVA